MPRKATGGKVGRPKKSATMILTPLQQKYIELVVRRPNRTAAEYARILGVSRAAISRWWNCSVVQQMGRRVNTEKVKLKMLHKLKSEAEALAIVRGHRITKIRNMEEEREVILWHFVVHNWRGPTPLPGGSKPIVSKEQYFRVLVGMARKGKWPLELLEKYGLSELP